MLNLITLKRNEEYIVRPDEDFDVVKILQPTQITFRFVRNAVALIMSTTFYKEMDGAITPPRFNRFKATTNTSKSPNVNDNLWIVSTDNFLTYHPIPTGCDMSVGHGDGSGLEEVHIVINDGHGTELKYMPDTKDDLYTELTTYGRVPHDRFHLKSDSLRLNVPKNGNVEQAHLLKVIHTLSGALKVIHTGELEDVVIEVS